MTYVQHLGKAWIYQCLKKVTNRVCELQQAFNSPLAVELRASPTVGVAFKPRLKVEPTLKTKVQSSTKLCKYLVEKQETPNKLFRNAEIRAKNAFSVNPKRNLTNSNLSRAAERVSEACKFPNQKFTPISLHEAVYTKLKPNTGSGYGYIGKKGKNFPAIYHNARSMFQNLDSDRWLAPLTTAFRLQQRADGKKVEDKPRLIFPVPADILALELCYADPFIDHFSNTETFYCIGDTGADISHKLKQRFRATKRICSLDASAWDQSMMNEVSIAAFSVLRQQLKLTPQEAECFEKLVTYFCASFIYIKDQDDLYIKVHGIPSGTAFTNLIGSLCHAIIIEMIEPGILSEEQILICSDDNIFNMGNLKLNDLYYKYKKFNITVKPSGTDVFNGPEKLYFLGYEWINFVRVINPWLAINQLVYHSIWIDSEEMSDYERVIGRTASILLNGANGADYFKILFPDLYDQAIRYDNVKFVYLAGYAPPLKQVMDGIKPTKRQFESLSLHLKYGWKIR